MAYIEFRDLGVEYDEAGRCFTCFAAGANGKLVPFLENARAAAFMAKGKLIAPEAYGSCRCSTDPDVLFRGPTDNLVWSCTFTFSGGPAEAPETELHIRLRSGAAEIAVKGADLLLQGYARCGRTPASELTAVKSTGESPVLHAQCGPAALPGADMLYDRRADAGVKFAGNAVFSYDWDEEKYLLEAEISETSPLTVTFEEGCCQRLFHLKRWKGVSHEHGFLTPPVGWMTWYAVRFDACEKAVLENARAMKKHFAHFSEKLCIWVDWEWCHRRLSDHGAPGVDVLHERRDAYPHGLGYVAEKIRKLGLVPALWTGATNDGNRNEMFRKTPGLLLAELQNWAGCFWLDLSHPAAVSEYIPRIFRQLLKWGYQAIKWDCLLNTMRINDEERARRYDPELSTDEAMHRCVAAGRKTVGDKVYLLGCTGMERATLAASDLFDACRIGGDVFSWEDFKYNAAIPIYSYFPLHNTSIFLDPDTLVLREEYSTLEQARSRVTLFALTGMQLTVGDPVAKLDPPRIDALKRAMPVPEIRPGEMVRKNVAGETALTLTAVARPFGTWHILGVFNLGNEKKKVTVDLRKDLDLPEGAYVAFDFWKRKLAPVKKDLLTLDLAPGGCAALRLTPAEKNPFFAGSTRHLLQGAAEMKKCVYDPEKKILSGTAELVANDRTEFYFCAPEGFGFAEDAHVTVSGRTAKLTLDPRRSGPCRWQIRCRETDK